MIGITTACICGLASYEEVFRYDAPPAGEVRFHFTAADPYRRRVLRCTGCGHFISVHGMSADGLYAGEYVNSTYGDCGIQPAFQRIVNLDPAKSDNAGRVRRVIAFARDHFGGDRPRSILDVGSGLCVFLHGMKTAGWRGTALDPDQRSVEHARHTVGVEAVCADFMTAADLGAFDVVTFNKVLEHVEDPVAMLARANRHVTPDGFIYVEVPDGEAAVHDGSTREEFFIDHHHVFSAASLALMAARAGFTVRALERLRQPSTKYTLRTFIVPEPTSRIEGA